MQHHDCLTLRDKNDKSQFNRHQSQTSPQPYSYLPLGPFTQRRPLGEARFKNPLIMMPQLRDLEVYCQ